MGPGRSRAGRPAEHAHGPAVPMLFSGVMLYLAADLAFQLRTLRTVTWTRIGVLVVLAVGLPVAQHLPAFGALTLLTANCLALVIIELVALADSRRALRRAVYEEKTIHEAGEAAWRARWHDEGPEQPAQ
nr:low temperature requirement protein A [Micromonospora sp. CB01531]